MRVTLKSVNAELVRLGRNVELAKGAGYFFFRGGEAENWIDRTVHVPAIGALTLEQWTAEYDRLKAVNERFLKQSPPPAVHKHATISAPPKHAAKPESRRVPQKVQPQKTPPVVMKPKEPCSLTPKLLGDVEQAYKDLAGIGEQQLRAARERRFSDLAALAEASAAARRKFDRALHAVRDHVIVHGC